MHPLLLVFLAAKIAMSLPSRQRHSYGLSRVRCAFCILAEDREDRSLSLQKDAMDKWDNVIERKKRVE
jgi:hypothetical protein